MGNIESAPNPYAEELKKIWMEAASKIDDAEVKKLLEDYPESNFRAANKTSVDITKILISDQVKFGDFDNFLKMNLASEPALSLFRLTDPTFISELKAVDFDEAIAGETDEYRRRILTVLRGYAGKLISF